jgi:hypothetical protein
MESIKKLEEQLVKNQQKHGNGKDPVGLKDDGSALTSNTEVTLLLNYISCHLSLYILLIYVWYMY